MEVRKGYKQTEIGNIPEDWDIKPLEVLTSQIIDGTHLTPKYMEMGVPFLRVTDIQDTEIDLNEIKFISIEEHNFLSRRCKPEKGDLLLSKNGTIGIPKIVTWDWEFSIFVSLALLKPREKLLNVNFLEQFFKSNYLNEQIQKRSKQGTVTNLHLEEIREFLIPVPTLAEQEAIAEALSDADALIESLETLLAKKRQVKQGAIQELITGKRRLPGFKNNDGYKQTEIGVIPEDWQVMTLAKLCRMKSGESITSNNIDQFSEYPCYGGNGLRGYTDRFTHDGNYALIGRQGALCGNVLGVSGKFFASEHAVVVTPFEQTDINWLTYVLVDMNLNQYSESSAQPGLSVSKILNLVFAIPSTKAEQTAIAEILSDMDAEIRAVEGKLSKARAVKAGMMSELLTGRVRLV